MTSEIMDLDAYRASFVAQTRTRLRKADRPTGRRAADAATPSRMFSSTS